MFSHDGQKENGIAKSGSASVQLWRVRLDPEIHLRSWRMARVGRRHRTLDKTNEHKMKVSPAVMFNKGTSVMRQHRSETVAVQPAKLTSTCLRSSSLTLNMDRGFRFMKLATKTSGIWLMRVL